MTVKANAYFVFRVHGGDSTAKVNLAPGGPNTGQHIVFAMTDPGLLAAPHLATLKVDVEQTVGGADERPSIAQCHVGALEVMRKNMPAMYSLDPNSQLADYKLAAVIGDQWNPITQTWDKVEGNKAYSAAFVVQRQPNAGGAKVPAKVEPSIGATKLFLDLLLVIQGLVA